MASTASAGSAEAEDIGASSYLATSPSILDLRALPLMFILATRLTVSEVHALEDQIFHYGGSVTHNPLEARLFLGKVGTEQRAEFELRCHGVWAENFESWRSSKQHLSQVEDDNTAQPPRKRRRCNEALKLSFSETPVYQIEDLSTEAEVNTTPKPSNAGSVLAGSRTPNETLLSLRRSSPAVVQEDVNDIIRVVNLKWLPGSIRLGRLLPLDSFVVYKGRLRVLPEKVNTPKTPLGIVTVPRSPVSSKPTDRSPTLKQDEPRGILERAKADAIVSGAESSVSYYQHLRQSRARPFSGRGKPSPSTRTHTVVRPPHLLHHTTSEHEEGASSVLPEMPDWVKQRKVFACERATPSNPPNEDFIHELEKIKLARLLTGDDVGVRAYSTSIAALAAYPHVLSSTREILALPGCDTKIAQLFQEWKTSSGHIQEVEDIEKDEVLEVLRVFYEIWGVGATTARQFYFEKGWRELDDLVEFGWSTLSRVQQIGVKYYEEFLEKIPRTEVELIASKVTEHAKRVRDGGIECCIVGGYRRGKAGCGDVDMIISHRDESKTLNLVRDIVVSLEQEGWVTHTLLLALTSTKRDQNVLPFRAVGGGHGFDTLDKGLLVWQDINHAHLAKGREVKNPNIHRRVDIIISPWRTVGCAIVGWSGGTTFQRDLRRYARKVKGWKFDSSGIRDRSTGEIVDLEGVGGVCKTWLEAEKKVFQGMGLAYREPWERCTG